MKKWFITGITIMLVLTCSPILGMGQSSRCVILEKQGNRALVSCDGGQTRFIDMRGRGDLYNVGDAVDAPDIDARPPKDRPDKQK